MENTVVATAIGEVNKTAKNVSGTSDREALFAALSYVQKNVVSGTTLDDINTALLNYDATDDIDDAKKVTNSEIVDITTIMADGFYGSDCLLDTDCGDGTKYFKIYSATKDTWQSEDYSLSDGQWIKTSTTSSADSDYRLTKDGWAARIDDDSGTYISDGQGGGEATQTGTGESVRISARMVDVAGKKAGNIAGLKIPDAAKDLVFATDSKLFWMQTTSLNDEYRLYTGYQIEVWNGSSQTPLTNLTDLISAYPTPTANGASSDRYHIMWNNLIYTFDGVGTPAGGTVSLWSAVMTPCTTSGCSPYSITGSAPYEIKTVFGQQVLIIKAQSPDNRGNYVMFAVKDGKLHGGSYEPAGADQSIDATFNKAAMSTIMKAFGHPDVVD